ncbi:MAG TPA: hypothetical protein VNS32_16900 [Flavisolibacter sp.]|nr:hypothetical protein [Flavisolibacter sp.]
MVENQEIQNIDYYTLATQYLRETEELKQALLAGVPWEDLRNKKNWVTQLAIALHRKKPSGFNPAESPSRSLDRPFDQPSS